MKVTKLAILLKVLSYWNLNEDKNPADILNIRLKVLSYWNLNKTENVIIYFYNAT